MKGNILPMFPTQDRYGATKEEWSHFSSTLRLTQHLLPVVSNPTATISPGSKMSALGKTPSRYNQSRNVSGFAGWTTYNASSKDIAAWSNEPDYGICLQTRLVRAIDIDIGDAKLAAKVQNFVDSYLIIVTNTTLPVRHRANSSKCLMAFTMRGEFAKRVIRTENGIIEFLANGQQFIAAGCHPSGARYEWNSGTLPDEFPVLDKETFNDLWTKLEEQFGYGEAVQTRQGATPVIPRIAPEKLDDVATYLVENGYALHIDRRTGRIDIECPFKDGHSTEGSPSSTSYFPANVGGFDRGHFKCQHASCAHRTDADFLDALGYYASAFDVIVPSNDADISADISADIVSTDGEDWPAFQRDKAGRIEPILNNLIAALSSRAFCRYNVAYDEFFDRISFTPRNRVEWRQLKDVDLVMLRHEFEALGFRPIGKELMRDAVEYVAAQRSFDSGKLWLSNLEWDGVPRVRTFFTKFFGIEHQAYAEACSLYVWTAHAGRLLTPGVQVDMSPILIGAQGFGKSSAVKAIVPDIEFYADIDLTERDDNLSRRMRGKLVVEFGEMRGFNTRDQESIKAYMTRTHDEWVQKYKEFSTSYPRRCVMWGTGNEEELFTDATGNRRWLPMGVPKPIDIEGIIENREQLWAEAAALYLMNGVMFRDAERIARGEHEAFKVECSWKEAIVDWINTKPFDSDTPPKDWPEIRTRDIIAGALGKHIKDVKRADEMKISSIMRELGYDKKRVREGGERVRVWMKK